MAISTIVKSLLENEKILCKSVVDLLLKIANNILNSPQEPKFRKINLNSEVTEKTLLPATGAFELLFLMGFEEGTDKLSLPEDASLEIITSYRDQLEQLKREYFPEKPKQKQCEAKQKKKRKQKVLSDAEIKEYFVSEAQVKNELEHMFLQVLLFESPELQAAARKAFPSEKITKLAEKRHSAYQKAIKLEKECTNPYDFQEFLLMEMTTWFKEEFFSWFDQGFCDDCQKNMAPVGYTSPNADELEFGAHRVEKFECENCPKIVRFPRYFHPGKLLQTRKGRCMEWASCFTLLCRALGMEARYIQDQTDHVWTEVYSKSQERWMHIDPCDNKMDTPLMYELGWGKKLSYIFAFSCEEIVDVVWRYSCNHKGVCQRRNRCREDWLALTISNLNNIRQQNIDENRKKILNARSVKEISGFFVQPKPGKEGETEGRSSGSLSWRLARGETSPADDEDFEPFLFSATEQEIKNKEIIVKYSAAQDLYVREGGGGESIKGWKSAMYKCKNLFRKHEQDWKQVYIARSSNFQDGEASWRLSWESTGLNVDSILIVFQHKTYEDGVVNWQICTENSCVLGTKTGVLELSREDVGRNCSYLEISATLSKGKGDIAWQHAQLFRQKDQDKEFPFFVKIKFI